MHMGECANKKSPKLTVYGLVYINGEIRFKVMAVYIKRVSSLRQSVFC